MNNKVSVIMPAYNSEKYIRDTIKSVIDQRFTNWELLIVDDCSTDKTCEIVERYAQKDSRIKLYHQKSNSGAASARNRALRLSTGRFIAYLDADDLWHYDKLEKQINFMLYLKCGFSCTSYQVIDDSGQSLNKNIHMLPLVDYHGFLKNNLLQTVGIMIDTSIVNKSKIVMPNMRRRQDAATWLQILKGNHDCYGLDVVLASYRRTENSLSSNKVKAVKGVWYLYNQVEKLSRPFCCYCFVRYAFLAVWKRLYLNKEQEEEQIEDWNFNLS